MSQPLRIDWAAIGEWEGVSNTAYVPKDANGAVVGTSGPTIGTGVDLGAWSAEDLRTVGVEGALVEKLRPYCGRKGQPAAKYVADHPLTIRTEERSQLDSAVQTYFAEQLANQYDSAVADVEFRLPIPRSKRFDELPSEIQTVLYSVAHQYGLGVSRRCPRFWKLATEQRWVETIDELKNFNDQTPSRRAQEAALIGRQVALQTTPLPTSLGTYVGQLVSGLPCGKGTLELTDGRTFDGGFAQGVPWGHGTLKYPNGDKFEGFVVASQTGNGVFSRSDGEVFVGGDPHRYWGHATIFYPDGRVYEGQTAGGYMRGQGRLTHPDGRIEEGRWAPTGVRYQSPGGPTEEGNTYRGPVIVELLLGEDGSGYVKHALDGTPVYAEINWSDGSSYKGGWSRDNKATGRGKYLNNEKGLEYSGWFSDGEAEGEGVLTIPEVTFKGTFRSGKVHDGTVISANGSVATGMWVDGKLTGAGTQKTDRGSYEGNFLEGEYDGEGKWRNTSTPEEYIGGFRQGMFERGTGIWLSQDGTQRFEGEWDRGRPNGQGQSWFPEGIYKGNFVDGQPGGQGRLSTPEGFVWDGNWTAGQPESGKVTWPDGSRFEGSFRNGKPDTGRYFDRHGRELRDPAGVRDHGLRGLRDGSDTEAVHHPRPGEICWTSARGDFVCLRARPGRPPNY